LTTLSFLDGSALIAALIWLFLIFGRGRFWLADQRLPIDGPSVPLDRVTAIIPARNEEEVIGSALSSVLAHDGIRVVLVDDHSADDTRDRARAAARGREDRLTIVSPPPLPAGWSGKLWALKAGIAAATEIDPNAEWFLLTDADIAHRAGSLNRLAARAAAEGRDMASLTARLDDRGFWGAQLIPAFIFYFQMLYPFPLVNDPRSSVAGAAGGCVLIRPRALARAGGVDAIRSTLIDDCGLAGIVKRTGGSIRLDLSTDTISLRPNDGLSDVWNMVARTAYTQLRHSPLLLLGTLIGMTLTHLVGPIAAIDWFLGGSDVAGAAGIVAWALQSVAFVPTLRLYERSPLRAPLLPVAGTLYSLMTLSSAWRHHRGRGGGWKGRVYPDGGASRGV